MHPINVQYANEDKGMRWVQGVQGGYEGYEVDMRGTRWVQGGNGVQGGYEVYEVGMRGMRWLQGV